MLAVDDPFPSSLRPCTYQRNLHDFGILFLSADIRKVNITELTDQICLPSEGYSL